MEYLLERIKEAYEMSKRMKFTMCFSRNSRFPDFENPFITEEDVQNGKFIIIEIENLTELSGNKMRYALSGVV